MFYKFLMKKMFDIFSKIEFYSALLQGKGYGSHTVKNEVRILNKLIKNPSLVIDIGANIGDYANEVLNVWPNVEIHLFEPSKTNYQILQQRFALPHVVINNKALSNKSGTGYLYADKEGSGLASLGKRRLDHFEIEYKYKEEIEIITFENYFKYILSERSIDVIKLDVEGFEYDVLSGFGDALKSVKIIQFEFGGCNLDTKRTFQDFWYFFNDHGFSVNRVTPFGLQSLINYHEIDEYYSTTNFICIKK